MSSRNVYRDILESGNDNSDVSEVDADDLAKMVKGVDDMDDALFGFKTKANDSKTKTQSGSSELKSLEFPINKPLPKATKTTLDDMPDGDLLADISLSDEDFYDLGTKSPSSSKKEVKKTAESPKLTSLDKLAKTKKIADLFGLDDEEETKTANKKKNDSAADWLGIKSSPEKKSANNEQDHPSDVKVNLADPKPDSKIISIESKKPEPINPFIKQSTFATNEKDNEPTIAAPKTNFEFKRETIKTRPKSGEVVDLLNDKGETKTSDGQKDKKTGIFEELFGESNITKTKTSRRNSMVKTPETVNPEPSVADESTMQLGEYKPSSSSARRLGLGRRRDPFTPSTVQTPASTLFQDDWLETSIVSDTKKETVKATPEAKPTPDTHSNEGLPVWLGGSNLLKASNIQVKPQNKETKESEEEVKIGSGKILVSEEATKPNDSLKKDPSSGDQVVESFRKTLTAAVENDQQTAWALQRTEAQLISALELQTTQSDLSAVCARQQSLLEHQEHQLTQLVKRQAERQSATEKQLTAQQHRIKQLMEVLTLNLSPEVLTSTTQSGFLLKEANQKQQEYQDDTHFKVELQHLTLEKEELKMRMKLMEKHYKMEFESVQMQHRREIESWEEQLARQKDLSEQLDNEFRERIKILKENEADLIAQHKERVERLKQERAEDVSQLLEFHKATLQHLSIVPPSSREEQKPREINRKPFNDVELSEKEKELQKKEKFLNELKEKMDSRQESLENETNDMERRVEQEKMKNEDISRQLKQEQAQLRYKEKQLESERKYLDEQTLTQRRVLEEMQETIMKERTKLASEQLGIAEERAKLEALAKLQGAKAEVHGALETARSAELKANEERNRLREKEQSLDNYRRRLKDMEEDLVARAEHLDRLMQVSEANLETGQKSLEEAKQLEKKAEEKMTEVERRRSEIKDKEQKLIRFKLEMAQEEIRINRKRQHLEHILPMLSSEEALSLQPVRDVIDPKMLIMRLRAEREFEVTSTPNKVANDVIEGNPQS